MKHRIETIEDLKVVGMKTNMTFMTIGAKTGELARQFMPRRGEVQSRIGKHVFSIQDYGNLQMKDFTPQTEFEKWVGIEVANHEAIPENMESFVIKGGIYVVFNYKGSVQDFPKSRQYIFEEWLPNSGYKIDNRAHFELLNEEYSKDLQNIEEEVWVPIV